MSKILTEQETQKLMAFLGAGVDFNGGQLVDAVQHWVSNSNEVAILSENVGQIAFNDDLKEFRVYNPNTGNVESILTSAVILQAIDEARNSENAVSETAVIDFIKNHVSQQLTEKLTGVYDSQGTISDSMANYPAEPTGLDTRIAVWVANASITVKDIELEPGDWLTYNTNDGWGKLDFTKGKASTTEFGNVKLASTFDVADTESVLTAPLVASYVAIITGQLEGLISNLTTRVTAAETGLGALSTRVEAAEGEIESLKTSQAAQDDSIAANTAEIQRVDSSIRDDMQLLQEELEESIESLDSKIDSNHEQLEESIDNLNDGVEDAKTTAQNASTLATTNAGKISDIEGDVSQNASDIQTLMAKDDYKILSTGLISKDQVFSYGASDSDFPLADIGSFHIENSFGIRALDGVLIDRANKTVTVAINFDISAGNYTLIVSGQVV